MAKKIYVRGVVQGVGFRPFVYGLASRLDLRGWVRNTSAGVEILVAGNTANIERFVESLASERPPLAKIDSIESKEAAPSDGEYSDFEIRASALIPNAYQPIAPDVAICVDCERELFDSGDRRYLHPFINCTNCGPRYTIIHGIPYDRPNTTMADFPLCDKCRTEYEDPLNRRFHAQPIACPECGPFVELRESHLRVPNPDSRISSIECRLSAILKARRLLREGHIVAIKGLGGFHLACDASNSMVVEELRRCKGRADKPFAVMAANMGVIESVCEICSEERELLTGGEKPIVLLQSNSRAPTRMTKSIAPGLDTFGMMLPYTPLHHLLLNQIDPVLALEPVPPLLVMTSGNFSEEPIATENQEALERLAPLADAFLLHNRGIHIRCDDSVLRVESGSTIYLRRSRGYAPYPVKLPFDVRPTLAVGGDLKNTFCLARDTSAFLSHHIGDMENAESYESFEQGVDHLSRVFQVEPRIVAHDLHPNYFTTQYANSISKAHIGVQHHHAHIAACMADNGLTDRQLIGLAFDGTGYGTDGAIWGGEVLLASYADFERFAHLEYLPLPGGDSAIHHPWRTAIGYAYALGLHVADLPFALNLDQHAIKIVNQQVDKRLNSALTSSMGRLFDAVASLIGIRNDVTYEAQAAIELEVISGKFMDAARAYPYSVEAGPLTDASSASPRQSETKLEIRLKELLKAILEDVRENESPGRIGARFHKTVAGIAIECCRQARSKAGLNEVALSGGVWQNQILLNLVRAGLLEEGFIVYFHKQVPTNDGGLALGQAVIANHERSLHR